MKNRELIEKFVEGEQDIRTGNLSVVHIDTFTLLVGYGHAVYAKRDVLGTIIVYDGWRTYSNTSARHLGVVRPHANLLSKGRMNLDDF